MSRLQRWSRIKRGVPEQAPPEETIEASPEAAGETVDSALPEPEEPAPGSLDETLPDPDTLGPGSDFRAFLTPGVSAGLKRRALRRLWATGNYGVRDGLDDYDDDYTRLAKLGGEAAEKLRHWTRKVGEALEEERQAPDEAVIQPPEDEPPPDTAGARAEEAPADDLRPRDI